MTLVDGRPAFAAQSRFESADDVVTWVAENAGSFAARIDILDINPYAASLSSSDVRESVRAGGEAETVPGVVQEYIEAQGLYREDLTDA